MTTGKKTASVQRAGPAKPTASVKRAGPVTASTGSGGAMAKWIVIILAVALAGIWGARLALGGGKSKMSDKVVAQRTLMMIGTYYGPVLVDRLKDGESATLRRGDPIVDKALADGAIPRNLELTHFAEGKEGPEDVYGGPFRLTRLKANLVEVRSAGPDGKLSTGDDPTGALAVTPASPDDDGRGGAATSGGPGPAGPGNRPGGAPPPADLRR